MMIAVWVEGIAILLLLAICSRQRSDIAQAKADVYQEFADTFTRLTQLTWLSDTARQKVERRRAFMRLALVDPLVRDGLWSALEEADEFWTKPAREGTGTRV